MKIDKKLNLVIPIESDNDSTLYVYAQPILRDVYDRYWRVIAKTHAKLLGDGLGWSVAPRVAANMLEEVAREDGSWEGPTGVARGLLADIVRMANVLMPDAHGKWTQVPLQEAFDKDFLSEDDKAQIKNIVTFFTVASWMFPRASQATILSEAALLWGGRTESLSCTEFANSLPTLTATASSGEKEIVSSIPH